MHASTFAIKFDPQAYSARSEPIAEIVYKVSALTRLDVARFRNGCASSKPDA
jgi:hypothetical protein